MDKFIPDRKNVTRAFDKPISKIFFPKYQDCTEICNEI